jgi:hypothetical protein
VGAWIAAVLLAGIHAFLFWWTRGPGKRAEYRRELGEPSQLPGPEGFWSTAFAATLSLPFLAHLFLWRILDVELETAAFVALAALIGSQLALFAWARAAWTIRRRRRGPV